MAHTLHNGTRVEVSGSGGYGNSCDVVQRTVTVGGELEFTDGDQASHFAGGRACSFVHAGFTQCPRVIIICYTCQCSVLSAQVHVYGLSSEKFNMLKPYIQISEAFRRKQDTLHFIKKAEKDTLAVYKYPEGTLVDLNEADTTELKKIPGIGSGIARMIVAYRKRLGGFYDMAQLKEVNYVDEDMLRWFKLGNAPIHRINANKAGLDKLRSHPYMNFYQAKVIIEYRRKKGKLKSLSQLSLYEEFTEKDLERLSHYLAFD